MNLKKRLEHIAHMSMKYRAMGRTTMIAKAAEATGGMVIARNLEQAKEIEREFKVPARSMDINLEGFLGPFFLDHRATEILLLKAADKIDELERKLKVLSDYVDTNADHSAKYVLKEMGHDE